MKAKEKCDELVDKMLIQIEYNCQPSLKEMVAKQCALIAVDEIIKVAPIDKYNNLISDWDVEDVGVLYFEEFWQEVKKEIELL